MLTSNFWFQLPCVSQYRHPLLFVTPSPLQQVPGYCHSLFLCRGFTKYWGVAFLFQSEERLASEESPDPNGNPIKCEGKRSRQRSIRGIYVMSTRCPCSTQRRCSTSDTTTRFLCSHRHEHLVRCNLHCRRGNPGNRPSCHVASCSRLFITINLIPWHSQSQRSRGPAVTKDSRDNWFWFPVTYPTQRDSYALPRFHPLLFFASLPTTSGDDILSLPQLSWTAAMNPPHPFTFPCWTK